MRSAIKHYVKQCLILDGRLAAAAAGLAYTQREAISSLGVNSWSFVTEHLEFVGALWKTEELKTRLQSIVDLETSRKGADTIGFHWFVLLNK